MAIIIILLNQKFYVFVVKKNDQSQKIIPGT